MSRKVAVDAQVFSRMLMDMLDVHTSIEPDNTELAAARVTLRRSLSMPAADKRLIQLRKLATLAIQVVEMCRQHLVNPGVLDECERLARAASNRTADHIHHYYCVECKTEVWMTAGDNCVSDRIWCPTCAHYLERS